MKTIKLFLLLIILIINSCGYESVVPLEKPVIRIHKDLLGTWKGEYSKDTYTVTASTDYIYKFKIHRKLSSDNHVMYGYLSTLNGSLFLNIWDSIPGVESVRYSFIKLKTIEPGRIEISAVTENITQQFSSSKELRDYFSKNMSNSYFYEHSDICVRSN